MVDAFEAVKRYQELEPSIAAALSELLRCSDLVHQALVALKLCHIRQDVTGVIEGQRAVLAFITEQAHAMGRLTRIIGALSP